MHSGKIKKLIRDRGFGFINAVDGREVFFHSSTLLHTSFDDLKEGEDVQFDVEKTQKGPKAINVQRPSAE